MERPQIYTDYPEIVKHEVTSLCVGCTQRGKKWREKDGEAAINHLRLSSQSVAPSSQPIPNNKQKQDCARLS